MILALLVAAVSGLGAVARYGLDSYVQRQHSAQFPYGTMAVNLLGSLLLGLVTGLAVHHGLASGPTVVLSAGFCSGFTTWSTYVWQTLALAEAGETGAAAANLLASLGLGMLAAILGYAVVLL